MRFRLATRADFEQRSASRTVAPDRLKLAKLAAAKQETIATTLAAEAPEPDFAAIVADLEPTMEHAPEIIRQLIVTPEWRTRMAAALVNGSLLALWTTKRDGVPILNALPNAEFAEPSIDTPLKALEYWRTRIPLTDAQYDRILMNLASFEAQSFVIAGEYSQAVMQQIADVFSKAIAEGMTLPVFRKAFEESIKGASKALTESVFRTNTAKAFGDQRMQTMRDAGIQRVPYYQWISVNDDRARATHSAMHGQVARADSDLWRRWRSPAGYQCRCVLSPLTYLECIRKGWVKRTPDRRGIEFIAGEFPNGPPPAYVFDPKRKALVRVIPDPGFAGDGASSVAA